MKKLCYFFIPFVFISFAHGATFYKWVDKDGVVNFTDDYEKIPPEYRDRVQKEEREEPSKVQAPAPAAVSPPKQEAARVDRYGQGEDFWRNKALPWKRQLKEATETCERTNKKINEILEDQSGKFLTPTQYKMHRGETRGLLDEKAKCEAQTKEANEMLEKIAKQAEEANADLEWVK